MGKEFIWDLNLDGEAIALKCVREENEVILFEGDQEAAHLKITNPEKKQHVLQIDTVTEVFGRKMQFQLENDVPYVNFGKEWIMSSTTFDERKVKLVRTHRIAAYVQLGIGIVMALACLVRYLVQGTMGDWWFLLVLGSFIAGSGFLQYREVKHSVAQLEQNME